MNSHEFIEALKISVLRNIEIDIINTYTNAPRRKKVSENEKELTDWYSQLTEKERKYILDFIKEGATSAMFGLLCVLDGVRAIENELEKGSLKLYYEKDGESMLLNDHNKEFLHDIFHNDNNTNNVS